MSVSKHEASRAIEGALSNSKKIESQFKMVTETASRHWQDSKQKQFFGRFVQRYVDTLSEVTREVNSILIQVKSIENSLKE